MWKHTPATPSPIDDVPASLTDDLRLVLLVLVLSVASVIGWAWIAWICWYFWGFSLWR
jgi:hypothetical protein